VFLRDGTHVHDERVKGGWCWWYRKYAPHDRDLEQLEKAAREAKQGLWADPHPVRPWVYRKARRGQSFDLSHFAPFERQGELLSGRRSARLSQVHNIMRSHALTIASTEHDALHGLLCVRSRSPQSECTTSTRRDKREWSLSFEMDSPTTEQPLRFVFPLHRESPLKLRGLSLVGSA